jgi:flagellar hook-associated protein 1 FlgK
VTIPTYAGLGTALSGLEAMQAGIDTTSENISNSSNPDYSRQRVNLVDNPSLTMFTGAGNNPGVEIGTGVSIQSITRDDNQFVDGQYWTANASSSYYSTLSDQLSNTEGDLNMSATTGLQSALTGFYSTWESLSTNPSLGSSVVGAGQTLTQQLNAASQQISTLQSQAGAQLSTLTSDTGDLHQYATDVAQLNVQIAAQNASGLSSNSLQDQRAQILDKLSGLVNIQVQQQTNGSDTINLISSTGATITPPLVNGGTPPTVPDPSTAVPPSLSTAFGSDWTTVGGTIGALAQLADTTPGDPNAPLQQMQGELDAVAQKVAGLVNGAVNPTPPGTATDFFSPSTGITAANIAVNPSMTAATLAGLPSTTDSAVYATQTSAVNDLSAFVSQVGNSVAQVSDSSTTASSLLTNLSNQRQSVSGVSLDEEMTNLITFQQGYQASARVMNTMQTVIQSLLTSVGG